MARPRKEERGDVLRAVTVMMSYKDVRRLKIHAAMIGDFASQFCRNAILKALDVGEKKRGAKRSEIED